MKTHLNQIATIQSEISGGRRALLVFFEYAKKPENAILEAEEIETILNAANEKAQELGIDGVWRTTPATVEAPELAADESLAVKIELTLIKISPDPEPEFSEISSADPEILENKSTEA